MDSVIGIIAGVGEYGLDVDHSPGVGGYYVKLYDGSYDASGFESEKEAREELEYIADVKKRAAGFDIFLESMIYENEPYSEQ